MAPSHQTLNIGKRPPDHARPAATAANDNGSRAVAWNQSALPADAWAIIRPVERSAMSSGRAGTDRWRLEFERRTPPFVDPLTGWTGGSDPLAHVSLNFLSRSAAIAYCERNGLRFEVRERPPAKLHLQVYRPAQDEPLLFCCLPTGPHAFCCGAPPVQ